MKKVYSIYLNKAMRKIIFIAIILAGIMSSANAQTWKIGFETGVGTYRMDQLKELNAALVFPFDTKLMSDFPAFIYYQSSIHRIFNQSSLGLSVAFQSTGSKISRKDYSGEYYFNNTVYSSSLCVNYEKLITSFKSLNFNVYSEAGAIYSYLVMKEFLQINNTVIADDLTELVAFNYIFEPGINFSYQFSKIALGLNIGYAVQIGNGAFHLHGEKEAILIEPDTGDKVTPDWTGIRVGLSVGYQW